MTIRDEQLIEKLLLVIHMIHVQLSVLDTMLDAIYNTLESKHTHLRQHLSTPGFAKLFPLRGKSGVYFGFTSTFPVCVRSASTLPG
jgi:hypothetical protein